MFKNREVPWQELAHDISGQLLTDELSRRLYANDASLYEQLPAAVVLPRNTDDCIAIVRFSQKYLIPIIPRAAGTSLVGQCVGEGLVIDTTYYMTSILDLDIRKQQTTVQTGTVLKDLNDLLAPAGIMLPVDPSTADRCTIGGMIGNNAWGVHTPLYGATRDWIASLQVVLSDGSTACFQSLGNVALEKKQRLNNLEGEIYRQIIAMVEHHRNDILHQFPGPDIARNNAGYALDRLARGQPWVSDGPAFSLAPLVCGSEGTLALVTSARLRLTDIPHHNKLACALFESLSQALEAVPLLVSQSVAAIELLDRNLLHVSHFHVTQQQNRFWLRGDPAAVLIIEIQASDAEELDKRMAKLQTILAQQTSAYATPVIEREHIEKVWELRRASLGMLMGRTGRARTVTMIEDCAVPVDQLAVFAQNVQGLMSSLQVPCIFYGPVSVGVIHLRPDLDLGSATGRKNFDIILARVTDIVIESGGTMTAKHGDGRMRSELLEKVLGNNVTSLFGSTKQAFDPKRLLNPGKIVAPVSANRQWRIDEAEPLTSQRAAFPTVFDWNKDGGLNQAARKCSGAGVCRKTSGRGLMCPSYMATRREQDSTRGRANVLRQILNSGHSLAAEDFTQLRQVMDLCLSCKGCKTECPAGVDMARMKAEVLHHDLTANGIPWRTRLLIDFEGASGWLSSLPSLGNAVIRSGLINKLAGFHPQRRLPLLGRRSFYDWAKKHRAQENFGRVGKVILFNDAFTNYYEPHVGIAALRLLEMSGYEVSVTPPLSSARLLISQGLLEQARQTLEKTLHQLQAMGSDKLMVVGIEPAEILTFRDEAIDLVHEKSLKDNVNRLSEHALLLEEFIWREYEMDRFKLPVGEIQPYNFLVHGHCHQKALIGMQSTESVLNMIANATVNMIPSGCCGMAGTFGYENEHFDLSMQIGEQVLFPAIRNTDNQVKLIASGASCRQQIKAGTGRRALHPAEALCDIWAAQR